jgi:hypothetical protein
MKTTKVCDAISQLLGNCRVNNETTSFRSFFDHSESLTLSANFWAEFDAYVGFSKLS